jgi:hypothetical protein
LFGVFGGQRGGPRHNRDDQEEEQRDLEEATAIRRTALIMPWCSIQMMPMVAKETRYATYEGH